MMNFHSQKNKRRLAAVIVILLVLAMLGSIIAYF